MKCFNCCMKIKMTDALALSHLGHSEMFDYLIGSLIHDVLTVKIKKHNVFLEVGALLTEKSNIDEIIRGSLEQNINQVTKGYAEYVHGFPQRLELIHLSPDEALNQIESNRSMLKLKDDLDICLPLMHHTLG